MPPKGITTYDWPNEFAEFRKLALINPDYTLKEHCAKKDFNYSNVSKHFAEYSRLLTGETLALVAPSAARKMGDLLQSKDEHLAGKMATAIVDRTGHSPKEQIIKVENNISLGVVMFSKEDEPTIKEMFTGSILDEVSDENS